MTPSAADAQCIEKILRECGSMLMVCRAAGRTEGEWRDEQFKAAADRIAHDFLVAALGEAFPGIPVVSEEDPASMGACTTEHFIIDPIDGTASFVHGFAGWVTQIAYVCANRPVLAGIYAPASDEYFSAWRGNGAYCNGDRLSVLGSACSAHTLIDNYPEARGITQDLQKALRIPIYVESGSIALKICRIADRSADLFFKNMSPRDWDVAAPMLVLEEAGGIITDAQGSALNLGGAERRHRGLIAAAHSAIIEQVRDWYTSLK
jgi:3'(2'), 5'-bisphosphate nucleotidase/myo-inositol-1(or 4)-monophosphatase